MEAEKVYQKKVPRTIQHKRNGTGSGLEIADNRPNGLFQSITDRTIQRIGMNDEEALQGRFDFAIQREEDEDSIVQGKFEGQIQKKNETGLPDNLKMGIETLSGFSMDNVRVHYNSSKPATVQALAYTRGTDILVAPGQERHLPHEAWHVVQQMAGRVESTTEIGGLPVNDNASLEQEADIMGVRANQF